MSYKRKTVDTYQIQGYYSKSIEKMNRKRPLEIKVKRVKKD